MQEETIRGETLMVLAGPKGAGKSTLLAHSLKTKIPLFGDHLDADFQEASPPGTTEEFALSTAEVLAKNTWASGPHLPEIAAIGAPRRLVAHIDLMNFCSAKERPFDSLRDPDANLSHMRRNPQASIFAVYASVHAATLATEYACCAKWFNARNHGAQRPTSDNDSRIYAGDAHGREAFAAIHAAWATFVRALPNLAGHSIIIYDEKRIGVGALFIPA